MQDRIARIDENLLHRTAGPYKRVKTRRLLCYRNVGRIPAIAGTK
jgi:hypothetical protein